MDIGVVDATTGESMAVAGSADENGRGPAHVAAPTEVAATYSRSIIADVTNTRQRFEIPSGAKWVHVHYQDIGTTAVNGQYLKVVFGTEQDPLTTAEADARLATAGAFDAIAIDGPGLSPSFADGNLCTTVDVIAAVAVGSGKTLTTIYAGF